MRGVQSRIALHDDGEGRVGLFDEFVGEGEQLVPLDRPSRARSIRSASSHASATTMPNRRAAPVACRVELEGALEVAERCVRRARLFSPASTRTSRLVGDLDRSFEYPRRRRGRRSASARYPASLRRVRLQVVELQARRPAQGPRPTRRWPDRPRRRSCGSGPDWRARRLRPRRRAHRRASFAATSKCPRLASRLSLDEDEARRPGSRPAVRSPSPASRSASAAA